MAYVQEPSLVADVFFHWGNIDCKSKEYKMSWRALDAATVSTVTLRVISLGNILFPIIFRQKENTWVMNGNERH